MKHIFILFGPKSPMLTNNTSSGFIYLLSLVIIILRKYRIKHGSLFKEISYLPSRQDEQNVIRLKIIQYDIPDY